MTDEKKTKEEKTSDEETGLATVEGEAVGIDDCEHSDVRKEILALCNKTEENYWALGELLYRVYSESLYQAWGYKTYRDYAEQEMGYSVRTAQTHIQIQEWLSKMPKNIQKWIQSLGYTRARILIRVVTIENASEWKAAVEGKTVAEIEKLLKGAKETDDGDGDDGGGSGGGSGSGGSSSDKPFRMSFSLFQAQKQNVETAIAKAKEMANSEKEGHALDLICTEFLSTNAGVDSQDEYLTHVEKNLGLTILAYDESTDSFVYGQEFIDRMNAEGEEDEESSEDEEVEETEDASYDDSETTEE